MNPSFDWTNRTNTTPTPYTCLYWSCSLRFLFNFLEKHIFDNHRSLLYNCPFGKKVVGSVKTFCCLSQQQENVPFSPFTAWKVLVLSIWCCSLGPNGRWRDTACTVHSTGRETKSRGIIHKTRWVGEVITACPVSIKNRTFGPKCFSSVWWLYIYTRYLARCSIHSMCVWLYQQQTAFQEMF